MKEIKTNNYKIAQEEHKEVNPSYSYEWFWEEVMESGGPNKLHFVGDMNSEGNFDQSYRDEYDPRTEIHSTPSIDHGAETNEVNVDIEGIIKCPRTWLQNQSIEELESRWNSDLETCIECYAECYGEKIHKSSGTEKTVWDTIGCALNEFENIYDVSRESSYCHVGINSLESISETHAKISFHVDAQYEASGDMHDPRDIY